MPAIRRSEEQDTQSERRTDRSLPMRTSLQGLINQAAGYGVGAVINRALGIVVALIYPLLLTRDEYGRLDVIFSFVTLMMVVFYLGMDVGLSRFYYEDEAAGRRGMVATVYHATFGFTVIVVAILLSVSRPAALWLYADPRYIPCFRLALVAMPFAMASSVQLLVLRLEKRIRTYNVLSVANLVLSAVVGISSILMFRMGPAGLFIGFVFGHISVWIAGMWILRHQIFAAPLRAHLRKILAIGLPMAFSGIAVWLIGYINRPILAHHVSADDLGLYAIASGGVGMMSLLIAAFRNAWQPFSFSIMGQEGSRAIYGHALTLFTAVGAAIGTFGTLFAPEVLLIINSYSHKNWSGAAVIVGPLALGTVFSAMYFMVQTGAYIARRTGILAFTISIGAVVNILLNFLLIPRFGIMGAAVATCAGYFAALIILYYVSQHLAPIPYQAGKLAVIVCSTLTVVILASNMHPVHTGKDLLTRFAIMALYCSLLLVTRTVTPDDLSLFLDISRIRRKLVPSAGCHLKGISHHEQ